VREGLFRGLRGARSRGLRGRRRDDETVGGTRLGRRAFTLTEILAAVLALVALMAAAGRILSSSALVARGAKANAEVMSEAAVIERRLREDLARLSPDGIVAIRCVAVPNDLHGGALLDPGRGPDDVIRADQLLVFTAGESAAHVFAPGAGAEHKGLGTAARVYFGHAFQLGSGAPAAEPAPVLVGLDPVERVMPWSRGRIMLEPTRFAPGGAGMFAVAGPPRPFDLPPPDARRWLLVRQEVALADDDLAPADSDAKTVYLGGAGEGGVLTARSLFCDDPRPELGRTPQILHGRAGAAATSLGELRRLLAIAPDGSPRPWRDQYDLVASALLHYPRAERSAPGMHRIDQALTTHVIGAACSSVRIDWTYADGDGAAPGFAGVRLDPGRPQPWFGLPDPARGVAPYGDAGHGARAGYAPAETILPPGLPSNVERVVADDPRLPGTLLYEAIFGFNDDRPLDQAGAPDAGLGFAPRPAAIRVTLVLHDRRVALGAGREMQFVVDLPRERSP
jgi:hypothetical protein